VSKNYYEEEIMFIYQRKKKIKEKAKKGTPVSEIIDENPKISEIIDEVNPKISEINKSTIKKIENEGSNNDELKVEIKRIEDKLKIVEHEGQNLSIALFQLVNGKKSVTNEIVEEE